MRSRLNSEDGFTLVELLASCLLLLVGILGVVATLDTSRTAISTAEVRETAAHRAERELERIRTLPWAQLGLAGSPSPQTMGAAASGPSEQVVTGGSVKPTEPFDDGRMRGEIHVLITTYDDPHVAAPVDARRVVVSVVPTGAWKLPRPVVASTVVAKPL